MLVSACAAHTPIATDRPESAAGPLEKRFRHESIRPMPGGECQSRPRRPRPALWLSASTAVRSGALAAMRASSSCVESSCQCTCTGAAGGASAAVIACASSNSTAQGRR